MGTDERLLETQISGEQKTTKRYKSTGLMDVLVICRDVLCSKEINKEKFDLLNFGYVSLFSKVKHLLDIIFGANCYVN